MSAAGGCSGGVRLPIHPPMQITAPGTADAMGQAQIMMLRKAMDMAVQNNAQLLQALPAAPTEGRGGSVDVHA